MPVLRRVKPALWVVAVLCVALPASASGAVTIGSNLEATANIGALRLRPACTWAHQALPVGSQAPGGVLAPSDGVVVRWRIKRGSALGTDPTPAALRITRPGNSATRISAGTGPTVIPAADQISTFDVRLPIQAGDTIGIDCCAGDDAFDSLFAWADTAGASYQGWSPRLVDGEPPRAAFQVTTDELLVNADIEPDADEDGFGDETQDQCPTDASTQGTCPPDTDPPETEITKGAPNKTRQDQGQVQVHLLGARARPSSASSTRRSSSRAPRRVRSRGSTRASTSSRSGRSTRRATSIPRRRRTSSRSSAEAVAPAVDPSPRQG